jgi:molecular chaperone GrpE
MPEDSMPNTDQVEIKAAEDNETMPSLGELLKQAELNAQEHHDAWLRAKAEADKDLPTSCSG